ncbi:MAG TPA: DUF5683 domain-containing protein [Candidatus Limnocylindrales bacterium]|nr:DUF5683 domain-containing protein [Candidatus Limnocylindrales bacterium]
MPSRTSPFAALVLSAVLPGLGQIYNRETQKGLVIFASCLGLALFTYWLSDFNKIGPALALVLLWLSAAADAYKVAKTSGQAPEFYYRKTYVVAMLLLVGPLGLPLLWQSPNFSRTARWIWTVVVVAAALMFIATPYLFKWVIG